MRVIERCCRGKRADQSLNEDGLVLTDGFAAVVDGVTSKSVRRLWRPSGGVVAKNLLLEAIADLPADATMRQVQTMLDGRLRAQYAAIGDDAALFEREPWERLQANAVVYSAYRREAWLFGDCQIMVNGVATPTVKCVDVLFGELRSFAAQALALECGPSDGADYGGAVGTDHRAVGTGDDPARAMILPFLRLQSRFANRRGEYGYFVFDGFTDPTYPIRTVSVSPGDDVVLASDGYPLLRPTLAESERELDHLRRDDPRLIREYRTTKGFTPGQESFDDRTYLRFVV
ncbi:hypothetical protein JS533_002860 [Bifidobacterium amazonense]|uniref:Protein phosphatase 2C n=1 Tax=Bifidobacterium amazonense TaxID=2809027 RepID=A0ABS9VT28_9BIFI|nr:hypothetical protein [Bifidobacterium amazonense]MCH9275218.1 hypothetical protein [Bifidobacterium amazonense]